MRIAKLLPMGTRFGRLSLVDYVSIGRKAVAKFKCDCGGIVEKRIDTLKKDILRNRIPSCGCWTKERQIEIGHARFDASKYMLKKYGKLLITGIDFDISRKHEKTRAICMCDCGSQAIISINSLEQGHTLSCGCIRRESMSTIGAEIKHGHAGPTYDTRSSIHKAWTKIRGCCFEGWRKGFHKVCHEFDPRWDTFLEFYKDFGPIKNTQTISRLNNQLPWSKENCYINQGRLNK